MTDHNHNFSNIDNIEFIRLINRAILDEAFKMLTEGLPNDNKIGPKDKEKDPDKANDPKWSLQESERNALRKVLLNRFSRMWGNDTAVEFLSDIADTELKIEKQRPSGAAAHASSRPPLSEKDIELIREFARREEL